MLLYLIPCITPVSIIYYVFHDSSFIMPLGLLFILRNIIIKGVKITQKRASIFKLYAISYAMQCNDDYGRRREPLCPHQLNTRMCIKLLQFTL